MRPSPSSASLPFPTRTVLTAALLALFTSAWGGPSPAESARTQMDWYVVKTDRFKLLSGLEAEASLRIARDLEQMETLLSEMFRRTPRSGGTPTLVVAFRDTGSFLSHGLSSEPGLGPGLAGFFARTPFANFIAVNAASGNDHGRIVRHEQTHLFLSQTRGEAPLWLDEGLAEYLSTLRTDDRRMRVGEPTAQHLERLGRDRWIPLESFLVMTPASAGFEEAHQAGLFHAQSWLLVHFLLHDGGGRPWSPERLLELENEPHARSLLGELGWDARRLEAGLREYAARPTFASTRLPKPLGGDSPTIRRAGWPAVFTRLGQLAAFVREDAESAGKLFRAALRIAPRRSGPNAGLGYLLELQGLHGQAEPYFKTARAPAGVTSRVSLMRGYALLQRFELVSGAVFIPADELDPLLARARDEFERSIAADPDLAEAHAGLGTTYLYESGDPARGIAALERARTLLPQRMDWAALLALLYAHAGDLPTSRTMMDLVERRSRDRGLVDHTRHLLILADRGAVEELLDRGGRDEAESALRELLDDVEDPRVRANLEAGLMDLLHSLESDSPADLPAEP